MKIGISSYPTYGGSGVVAAELGKALAARGHEIHFISYEKPTRISRFYDRIFFHEVEIPTYPLFEYPPYSLSLASKMVEVIQYHDLDVLHVHYCIPHSLSAYLAKQILPDKNIKIVTTLHGTDITLVGRDPSFYPVTKFGIEQSDGVTTVSNYLKERTEDEFCITCGIKTIYNFIDTRIFQKSENSRLRAIFAPNNEKTVTHVSNFRPVKKIENVIYIFNKIIKEVDAVLLLVGDGPERAKAEKMCREMGICEKVRFLGKQDYIIDLLSVSDLFLMPSELESFGLSALEAMSCEVPVIASAVGGLKELITDDTGYLIDKDSIDGMAQKSIELLTDENLSIEMGQNARKRAEEVFDTSIIIPQYEEYYDKIRTS
ncbi:N-acetyl-alpha-D-glucosaminyl L-malate synthase BshA [bacterium]|nr:N-acetyl-alpha-D-glucosaminyl L-malate synthase BshA [bacterium]